MTRDSDMDVEERGVLAGVAALYTDHFREHGLSLAAVECPKAEQMPVRFDALMRNLALSPGDSLLDYGCGLAHLLEYVRGRSLPVRYVGVDVCEAFIASDRERFPGVDFAPIGGPADVKDDFDHVVLSGVFGVRYVEDVDLHFAIVQSTLTALFQRTRKTLAVNFMTDLVDFRQPHAFHLHPADFCRFAQRALSRRVVVDQSYMPFEYTVTVFRQDGFSRPGNIFVPAGGDLQVPASSPKGSV